RKVAASVLGIMFFMAGVGLILALLTVHWRRQNDFRLKREPSTPPLVQAPGELAGLGFVPAECNVVAALQVAELLNDPVAKKLLASPRPALLDLVLGTVEKWTKLTAADLDHIVMGSEIKS